MADKYHREREVRSYYSYYSADGEPAECPACRGMGKVLLLVSSKPCEACGGTGKVAFDAPSVVSPDAASEQSPPKEPGEEEMTQVEERVPGHWVSTCTFDRLDRLVSQVDRFVPDPPPAGKPPPDGAGAAGK